MYTDSMRRAFRSLDYYAPKGFSVEIIDNDNFITVRAKASSFVNLSDRDKKKAVEYMSMVKKAFEDLGSIVLLTRTEQ